MNQSKMVDNIESRYSCPQEMLQQPALAKFTYFKNVKIFHPKLAEVKTRLLQAVKYSADFSVPILCGPTGVGVSTVLELIGKDQVESPSVSEEERALTSTVGCEALPFEPGSKMMKSFYIRALDALSNSSISHSSLQRQCEMSLHQMLVKLLHEQKTKLFYIDDAHNFIGESKLQDFEKRITLIRFLAQYSGVQFLLGGNYDLAEAYRKFEQPYRRTTFIEFPRYKFDDKQDLRNYLKVVEALLNFLPLRTESDLLKHHAFYCERSIGCVGLLKDWLLRALAAALEGGCSALSIQHLEPTALTAEQCRSLLAKAQRGECSSEKGVPDSKLQAALGLMKKKSFERNPRKLPNQQFPQRFKR